MATRSNIGVKENGIYKLIYCHWDGYIEHTGALLFEHYNDYDKILELISLGDISKLNKHPSCKEGINDYDVTIAFHRDGGYEYTPHRTLTNLDDSELESYVYFYDVDMHVWYVYRPYSKNLSLLKNALAEIDS